MRKQILSLTNSDSLHLLGLQKKTIIKNSEKSIIKRYHGLNSKLNTINYPLRTFYKPNTLSITKYIK